MHLAGSKAVTLLSHFSTRHSWRSTGYWLRPPSVYLDYECLLCKGFSVKSTSERPKPFLKLRSFELNRKKVRTQTMSKGTGCLSPSPSKSVQRTLDGTDGILHCEETAPLQKFLRGQIFCNGNQLTVTSDFYPQLKSHHGNYTSSYLPLLNSRRAGFPGRGSFHG